MLYDERLLNEQQTKIENAYRQIGEQYYAAHKDDADNDFAALFNEIKASRQKMDDHRAMVMRANGLMLCPQCGQQISLQSVFCNFCGTRLKEPEPVEPLRSVPAEEPKEETAPSIDVPPVTDLPEAAVEPVVAVPPTRVFEPETEPADSGEAVAEEESAEVPEEVSAEIPEELPEETPAEAPEEAPEEAPAAAKRICPNCGAEVAEDFAFCIECGARYTEPQPAPVFSDNKTTYADAVPSVRFCTECGYKVTDSDALFCNNCGARLEAAESANDIFSSSDIPVRKKCRMCGFETDDPEVRFCVECGARLD